MNQTITLDDLLPLLGSSRMLVESSIFIHIYDLSPYLIAIPQCLLNLCVVIILLLSFTYCRQSFHPGLVFLLNLALTDVIHAVIICVLVELFHSEDFTDFPPQQFAIHETAACKIKAGLLCFIYIQSTMSTVFLTLDRYLTIVYLYTYPDIMTKRRAYISISLCWLVPSIIGIASSLTIVPPNQETINACSSTHLGSKVVTTVLLGLMICILISIYILYIRILFSFWRLKRKRSIIRNGKSNEEKPNMIDFNVIKLGIIPVKQKTCKSEAFAQLKSVKIDHQSVQQLNHKKSPVYDNLYRLGRYIKASKYVLVILILFTLCWLPWLLSYAVDLLYHQAGFYHQAMLETCGSFNTSAVQEGVVQPEVYLCVRNMFRGKLSSCQLTFPSDKNEDKCGILYEILHERLFENVQLLMITLGACNSLFNPIVYAIWCEVFRRTAGQVASQIRKLLKVSFSFH
jgi:hypothetical protein